MHLPLIFQGNLDDATSEDPEACGGSLLTAALPAIVVLLAALVFLPREGHELDEALADEGVQARPHPRAAAHDLLIHPQHPHLLVGTHGAALVTKLSPELSLELTRAPQSSLGLSWTL